MVDQCKQKSGRTSKWSFALRVHFIVILPNVKCVDDTKKELRQRTMAFFFDGARVNSASCVDLFCSFSFGAGIERRRGEKAPAYKGAVEKAGEQEHRIWKLECGEVILSN